MLIQKLGYQYLSVGNMKRQLAEQMGLSIHDFNTLGEQPGNAERFDKQYEDMQRSLDPKAAIILDSRLGFYCQPQAFNVFLDVDIAEAARRIMEAGRGSDEGNYGSLQDAIALTQKRNDDDQSRYIKLYNIDYFDHKNYDLVVDTSDKTPAEVLDIIIDAYTHYQAQQQ
jgi:cytidylate kinase